MNHIAENLARLRADIGQTPFVAVSKGQGLEAIREALAAGHRRFGESRVQEALGKFAALRPEFPDLELHLIGPLQTNKVATAVALFDVIQTLDRISLAEALVKERQKKGRLPRLFIQVNVGDEPQKSGVSLNDFDNFYQACRDQYELSIDGLMCLPPREGDPVPYFKKLKSLADDWGLGAVSMGMSADYRQAILCGSTMVRIGSALFRTE